MWPERPLRHALHASQPITFDIAEQSKRWGVTCRLLTLVRAPSHLTKGTIALSVTTAKADADLENEPTSKQLPSAFAFLKFAAGFWTGSTRRLAWMWTAGALTLIFTNLLINVGLNKWNRWFYDALERKDGATLLASVAIFLVLIVAGAGCAVAMIKCRMTLQLRWREWLTNEFALRWLGQQRFYKLAITDEGKINPEYRLAEDVRLASEPVVEFVIGFVNALLSAVAFVSILFLVGGSLSVSAFGTEWLVPGPAVCGRNVGDHLSFRRSFGQYDWREKRSRGSISLRSNTHPRKR
jgi:ABC-type uncharacterized transport system fused permease/ATPase subunit